MEAPQLECVFGVNIGFKGYRKMLNNILYEGIEDLGLESSNDVVFLRGKIDPIIFISKLYKARSYVRLLRLNYGYEENLEGIPKPNSPFMSCRFKLNISDISWYKRIIGALKVIQGVSFIIDAYTTMQGVPNALVYLHGIVDPIIFISKLYKVTSLDLLERIDYGYEENPEGTRKPSSQYFMRSCCFTLNTLDISWYTKIIGALKVIQGVSFIIAAQSEIDIEPEIDAQLEMGYHMAYLSGNVEIGVLMKMFERMDIQPLKMEYGVEYKDANMNPPPKKLEASANGTETKTSKDTESSPPEVVKGTSKKHQVIYKKPRGLRRFCFK